MSFPVFASGDVLNASDMNAVGLWLIKTQTVGTGVTSVNVTSAFSSTYDNYKITYTGGVLSTLALVSLKLGAATTSYYGSRTATSTSGTAALVGDNNTGSFQYFGIGNATWMQIDAEVFAPNRATRSFVQSRYWEGTGALGVYTGYQDSNTQFTDFTLSVIGGGTMTGGTICVYGYRN